MALSKQEIALYAYITGRLLPKKTTRRAFNLAVAAAIRGAQALAPVAGRAAVASAPTVGRTIANPYVGVPLAAATGTYALQRYLDESGIQAQINEAERQAAMRYVEEGIPALEEFARTPQKVKKKAKSAFNRGVSSAMKAVKASKFQGKPGILKNPKGTFSMVSKTVSKISKGGKVASKGVSGVIKRATAKINFPKSKPKTKKRRGSMVSRAKRAVTAYI